MPKFQVRLSQKVFYNAEVEADSFAAAIRQVARQLYGADADEPNLTEIDSNDFVIEASQTDERGDELDSKEVMVAIADACNGRAD